MSGYYLPNNFGALSQEYCQFETSRVTILPVPYEQTTSYGRGTKNGPRAIIEASRNMELYDEELEQETSAVIGIHTLEEVEPVISGPEEMVQVLCEIISDLLRKDKIVVTLGGEHSLTLGAIRAYLKKYPDISILQLDAHADLRDSYQGSVFNHATVMRRIRTEFPATPILPVGIRSMSAEEAHFINDRNLPIFSVQTLLTQDKGIESILAGLTPQVYITIDLDVFDPSIMPAVGTPEPGGLSWYQMLNLVRTITAQKQVVGFDIVELSPIPGLIHPDFLAAKLIYKIIGYLSLPKQPT
jgi:agmatinase